MTTETQTEEQAQPEEAVQPLDLTGLNQAQQLKLIRKEYQRIRNVLRQQRGQQDAVLNRELKNAEAQIRQSFNPVHPSVNVHKKAKAEKAATEAEEQRVKSQRAQEEALVAVQKKKDERAARRAASNARKLEEASA